MIQPHESLGDDTGLIQPVVHETGSNTEVVVPDTTAGEQAGAVLDLAGAEIDLTKLPTVSSGFNTTKVGLGAFFADLDAGYGVQLYGDYLEILLASLRAERQAWSDFPSTVDTGERVIRDDSQYEIIYPLGQTDYKGSFIKPFHELDDSSLIFDYTPTGDEVIVNQNRILDTRYSGEMDLGYGRTSNINFSHSFTLPENPELLPYRIDRSWTPGDGLEGDHHHHIPVTQADALLPDTDKLRGILQGEQALPLNTSLTGLKAVRNPITGLVDFVREPTVLLKNEVKPDESTDPTLEETAEPDTADDTEQ